MTKLIRLAVLAAVAAGAGSLRADYFLRWQVENSNFAFDTAAVMVTGDGGYSAYLADADALSQDLGVFYNLPAEAGGRSTVETQGQFAPPEDSGNYLFQIQLFDSAGEQIAASSFANMADLGSEGLRALSNTPMSPADGVWTVSTFHAVPEPTSGMLFLLGLASLALRRRRV